MGAGADPAADPGTAEDCLTLSVTAPAGTAPGAGLPVLVWLHGGGFRGGSGSDYDPRRMVADGRAVVVTVNYRLGALGFLSWPGLPGEGAFGPLDQQAALRWVRREIAGFGGDPARVTLAGESAGAESVCAQLTAPGAAGLFARAVLQSSSCTSADIVDAIVPGSGPVTELWKPLAAAEGAAGQLAAAIGCGDPATALACLRAQPTATLIAAPPGYWSPVIGTATLPERPSVAVAAGRWAGVPVLIGTTRDEGLAFVADAYRAAPLDPARFSGLLAQAAGAKAGAAALAYPLDARGPTAVWAQVMGDRGYSCPNLFAYPVFAAQVPTFAYEFGAPPDAAAHSTELPFLFTITGGQPEFVAQEEALGAAMRSFWSAFCHLRGPRRRVAAVRRRRPGAHAGDDGRAAGRGGRVRGRAPLRRVELTPVAVVRRKRPGREEVTTRQPSTIFGRCYSPRSTPRNCDGRHASTVLNDLMVLVAAVLAGTGGSLLGIRGADALNRLLGRAAPPAAAQRMH